MLEDIARALKFVQNVDRASFARDERSVFAVAYASDLPSLIQPLEPLLADLRPKP
ncbi:MAG: hypothetical protein R3B68_16315 [Phycisphaerales bacterium]